MSKLLNNREISIVGHPFAPIGMGEHARCSFRSFRSVGVSASVIDIYGLNVPETDAKDEFESYITTKTRKINIFHINGDEVEPVLAKLTHRRSSCEKYNIIYPLWELSRYPAGWARELEKFDEIWAPSRFIEESVASATNTPVVHMPLACESFVSYFLDRRYFGIQENKFTFLFFFDVRSYVSRKNPEAILKAFKLFLKRKPFSGCLLVIKINGSEVAPKVISDFREKLVEFGEHILVIDKNFTDTEVKNLVRVTDCFVSLHRSEGYGRGLAEAMFFGKPVICTGYSGNMDFTTAETALLVDYKLIPLLKDEYPFWDGQNWADPDAEQASMHMQTVYEDVAFAKELGRKASLRIRTEFGYRATGARYMSRIRNFI